MAISAPFGSVSEADNAYFQSSDSSETDTNETETTDPPQTPPEQPGETTPTDGWGDLQQGDQLGSGWVLAYQEQVSGDRQRWFVIRTVDGELQALNSQGREYTATESDTLSDLPHFVTETDAREAFGRWRSQNQESEQPTPEEENWTNWQKLRQEGPWWVFSRTNTVDNRSQFLVAGKNGDGSTVYLGTNGSINDSPHIFESVGALRNALQAYFQQVQDGTIPETDQPTGETPTNTEIREAVRESVRTSSESQQVERIVEKFGGRRVVLGAVAVLGIVAYQQTREGA